MFSVVIPNYNGRKFLEQCLNSIFGSRFQVLGSSKTKNPKPKTQNLITEIIVVDNNSTDGSKEYLKGFRFQVLGSSKTQNQKPKTQNPEPKIRVIFNDRNLGFAAAVNKGILAAKNDYVVVMNNDLRVEKDWFQLMAEAIEKYPAKENKIAAYFGTVLNWNGTKIESRGLKFWIKGKAKNIDNGRPISKLKIENDKWRFIWGTSASVVVYYKPALLQVGLFDEDFFAYEEDVDLALRLAGAGWKTLYLPQAISYHLGGGTSSKMGNFRQRMDAKNWWFIVIKNYPFSVLIKYGPQIFIERLRNLSGLLKATPIWRWIPDLARTYGEVLVKLPKMLKKRRPIDFLEKLIVNS